MIPKWVVLPSTIQFSAGDAFETVKILCTVADKQTGWQWLTVRNLRMDDQYYILSFGFLANTLQQVQLIVSQSPSGLTAGRDDWAEENERKILTELRT